MGRLARIAVHPIKSLDQHVRDHVSITEHGGLEGDRRFAIVDDQGRLVNGKRTAAVHRIRATVDDGMNVVTLRTHQARDAETFDLEADKSAIDGWLRDYFGFDVRLRRTNGPAMTDIGDPGPTIISAATIETVASWFSGIDTEEMTRRLRPNLVVEDVDAFWEDRLVTGGTVRIGGVRLEGVKSVPRCTVPARDPSTGAAYSGFRETFVRKRKETFPSWADPTDFPGYYSLMAATHSPPAARGSKLAVGDPVEVSPDHG